MCGLCAGVGAKIVDRDGDGDWDLGKRKKEEQRRGSCFVLIKRN